MCIYIPIHTQIHRHTDTWIHRYIDTHAHAHTNARIYNHITQSQTFKISAFKMSERANARKKKRETGAREGGGGARVSVCLRSE
jgi:hypothetical protein